VGSITLVWGRLSRRLRNTCVTSFARVSAALVGRKEVAHLVQSVGVFEALASRDAIAFCPDRIRNLRLHSRREHVVKGRPFLCAVRLGAPSHLPAILCNPLDDGQRGESIIACRFPLGVHS
jgi:hypothetical protein